MPHNHNPSRCRASWWQPNHLCGAVLADVLASLATAAVLAVVHHLHLTWQ